jgi:hypothetical protein
MIRHSFILNNGFAFIALFNLSSSLLLGSVFIDSADTTLLRVALL